MFDTALYIMGQSGQSLDEQISRLLIEVESPEERYGHFMMQRSRDDAVMDPDELRYGQENYLNFILADDTVPPARKDMFKEDMTVSRTPMEVLERGLSRIQGWNKNLEPVRQDYERRATQTNTI